MSKRRVALFGFVVMLLVSIPLSVFIAQKRQETRTRAAPSTKLSFNPATKTVGVGETIKFDIVLDPGSGPTANQVSFVKLVINYDSTKLSVADPPGLTANTNPVDNNTLTDILEGPTYPPGVASITLSIGPDPAKAIKTITKIATISFKTLEATTADKPTKILFDGTQVLSVAPGDEPEENVSLLSTSTPATVTIGGQQAGQSGPTSTPIPAPTLAATPTPQGPNTLPKCTGIAIDREASGSAPFQINFGVTGNDPDGTISKATFNFGDTVVENVTTGDGIGTNSVDLQRSHTYKNPGTFTASAILTDNNGALSSKEECSLVIMVSGPDGVVPTAVPSGEPIPTELVQQPLSPIPPPGPTDKIIGIGIVGLIISIIGGVLFFTL